MVVTTRTRGLVVAASFLVLSLVSSSEASYRYAGPGGAAAKGGPAPLGLGGRSKPAPGEEVMLKGSIVVNSYDETRPDSKGSQAKQVGWSAKIVKSVVLWDELSNDGFRITSASSKHVELEHNDIDDSDFQPGTVFVIDVDDWERASQTVDVVENIPEDDDALFFEITSSRKSENSKIYLLVQRIAGEDVVPEVDIDLGAGVDAVEAKSEVGDLTVYDDKRLSVAVRNGDELPAVMRSVDMAREDGEVAGDFLPTVSHYTKGFVKKVTIFNGTDLTLDAQVTAEVTRFRFERKSLKIYVKWEQRLAAEAGARLQMLYRGDWKKEGLLVKVPTPLGFSGKIPFLGRASAGVLVGVDYVLELNAEASLDANFRIHREIRRDVSLQVFREVKLSSTLLEPLKPNSQTASLEVKGKVYGFAGVRPALILEASLRKKALGANIGVTVGVDMNLQARNAPPFPALTSGGGIKKGPCDECHLVEGDLSARVKDLEARLISNGEVKRSYMIEEDILNFDIATVCAVKTSQTCAGASEPCPVLAVGEACGAAGSCATCPSNTTCQNSKCTAIPNCPSYTIPVGSKCSKSSTCAMCVIGSSCTRKYFWNSRRCKV